MEKQKTIKLGILGCAHIVEKYMASAIAQVPSCSLAAIASRNFSQAQEWAKKFHCHAEESYESLLQRPDIDAVYIPLPVALHKPWVIRAAELGKHVLCEKSLAESLQSASEMIAVCQNRNLHLYENFMCNFHPQHEKISALLTKDEIGKVFSFHGAFGFPPLHPQDIRYKKELGGGSLNDAGAYPLFMARKLLAAEPVAVTCKLEHHNYDVDLRGNAFLEFPDGKSACISFGFDNFYQNTYFIWGEKGKITAHRAYSIPPEVKPEVKVYLPGKVEKLDLLPANHFALLLSDFCQAVSSNKKPQYAPLLAQARAMEALRLSSEKKRKVLLAEIE